MLLALAAIGWVLYTASGKGRNETIVPEPYQQSLEKAEGVEQMVNDAAEQRLKDIDP
jgi:protein-tyrosine-phosphatase